eukprot:356295-Chlamydomonas_euryale.AAC.22
MKRGRDFRPCLVRHFPLAGASGPLIESEHTCMGRYRMENHSMVSAPAQPWCIGCGGSSLVAAVVRPVVKAKDAVLAKKALNTMEGAWGSGASYRNRGQSHARPGKHMNNHVIRVACLCAELDFH